MFIVIFRNLLDMEDIVIPWALCVRQRLYKSDEQIRLCEIGHTQTFKTCFVRNTRYFIEKG